MLTPILIGLSLFAGQHSDKDHCPPMVQIRIGGDRECAARPNYDQVDHRDYDALLHTYVDCQGMVNYAAWKCDSEAMGRLYDYLVSLGCVDVADPSASREGEIAFYINAYNALVLYGILQEYPTPSIQKHQRGKDGYHIFDDLLLWIDGEYLSLNDIEHGILRTLEEPRIHFAIVCAALDCPRLRQEAYVPGRLEEQLCDNAVDFFAASHRFRITAWKKTVYLSSILRWFGEDFGTCESEILARIMPYLPCDARDWLATHPCPKVKYLGYNWALNDACPSLHIKLGGVPYRMYAAIEPCLRPWTEKAAEDTVEESLDEEIPAEDAAASEPVDHTTDPSD